MDWVLALDRIPESGLDIEARVPYSELKDLVTEQWRPLDDALELSLHLERHGKGVSGQWRLSAHLSFACSRCAEECEFELEREFAVAWAPEGTNEVAFGEGLEVDPELPPEWYPLEGEAIDLQLPFRDELAMALPEYPRCSEECKGLCPTCGKNWNEGPCTCQAHPVDPRLGKLLDLKIKVER